MANASYHTTNTAGASQARTPRHSASLRRPPDPTRVYQTYLAERAIDEWGAFTRTAARYRKSDGRAYSPEWARKICKAYEAQQLQELTTADSDPLTYVAPPDGYPQPEPAPQLPNPAEESAESAPTSEPLIMSSVNGKSVAIPNPEPSNFQPIELEKLTEVNAAIAATTSTQSMAQDGASPVARSDVDPYAAARRAAALRDYRRRIEQDEAEQRRRQGLVPALLASDYAGVWFGMLIAAMLIALMGLG